MIHISENAAGQIKRLKTEAIPDATSTPSDSFLRVKVVPGGCSGLSYKLDFDHTQIANDKVFEEHGTKVVIDSKSLLYIAGMTLDFEGGLNGKGFVFSNPERLENVRLRLQLWRVTFRNWPTTLLLVGPWF